ncbi:P-loop containing nucleoside triphosphate hydrolase protein [Pelagophyceae sp. CCMP2097]|nr:P-loop containing nucleoside triphosphate hydrolase protein [Pelagophyceae sp. CCMP2097]
MLGRGRRLFAGLSRGPRDPAPRPRPAGAPPKLPPFLSRALQKRDSIITQRSDGERFLREAAAVEDGAELLQQLIKGAGGLRAMRDALAVEDSTAYVNDHVVPFFERLGAADMCRGTRGRALDQVVEAAYETPGFVEALVDAVVARTESQGDSAAVCWFAIRLTTRSAPAREDPDVLRLAGALAAAGAPRADTLTTILSGATVEVARAAGLEDFRDVAGGRHDNDRADYRSLTIAPTADELRCARPPYLPGPKEDWLGNAAAALIDRQFRLVREDMLGPMRDALRSLGPGIVAPDPAGARRQPAAAFGGARLERVETGPAAILIVSFALPKKHRAHRLKGKALKDYWESGAGANMFKKDSLVALVRGAGGAGAVEKIAVVARADWQDLARVDVNGVARPEVGLSFGDCEADDVAELLRCVGLRERGLSIVNACPGYFSYSPVLDALQCMEGVPFCGELLRGADPEPAAYLAEVDIEAEIESMARRDALDYDASQRDALRLALARRVSLTVGPPGTGKTLLGVRVADVIYRRTEEKILVLTHTNHALDDILGALLKQGMTSIARLGGGGKALDAWGIRNIARQLNQSKSRAAKRAFWEANEAMRNHKHKLDALLCNLDTALRGARSWRGIREHLLTLKDGAAARAALDVPIARVEAPGRKRHNEHPPKTHKLLKKQRRQQQQQHLAAKVHGEAPRPRVMAPDYLWERWLRGLDRGVFEAPALSGSGGIWALSRDERHDVAAVWADAVTLPARDECAAEILHHGSLVAKMDGQQHDDWHAALEDVRVIGSTTTAAAKYHDLLADIDVGVVIVEEAGEVLEAHTLTSLHKGLKHLVMIGDHKQLRPKLDNYSLTAPARVAANRGHDFNVSLFERLVVGGTRHGALTVQHRMRPEISALIRPTYPQLLDGRGTLSRPRVRGLDHSVVFLDHDAPEGGRDDGDSCDAAASATKTNAHEVQLVVSTVVYLLQQGYELAQIVVLTPYVGQLHALNKAFRDRDYKTFVGQRDAALLTGGDEAAAGAAATDGDEVEGNKADGDPASRGGGKAAPPVREGIRCATIDNFQGEEADIIVASLVRCNAAGTIGFLREPERVNVLLSRARIGEILVGSAATLRGATSREGRALWTRVLDDFECRGAVVRGLPARCEKHGATPAVPLDSTAAFATECPQGGCAAPCGDVLPCGHACPLPCHAFDHAHVQCTAVVADYCARGHRAERPCGTRAPATCATCDAVARVERAEREVIDDLRARAADVRTVADARRRSIEHKIAVIGEKRAHLVDARDAAASESRLAIQLEQERRKLERACLHGATTAVLERADERRSADVAKAADEAATSTQVDAYFESMSKLDDVESLRAALTELDLETQREQLGVAFEISAAKQRGDDAERAVHDGPTAAASPGERRDYVALRTTVASSDDNLRDALRTLGPQDRTRAAFFAAPRGDRRVSDPAPCSADSWPPALQRGGALLVDRRWLDAYGAFTAVVNEAAEGVVAEAAVTEIEAAAAGDDACSCSLAEDAGALAALCKHQLGIDDAFQALSKSPGGGAGGAPLRDLVDAFAAALAGDARRSYGLALACAADGSAALAGLSLDCVRAAERSMDDASLAQLSPAEHAAKRAAKLRADAGASAVLGDLLGLTGLWRVKRDFVDLRQRVRLDAERASVSAARSTAGPRPAAPMHSAIFTGNPGTGKTTVARLYGELLAEVGALPGGGFEETSGAKLLADGVAGLRNLLGNLVDDGSEPLTPGERVKVFGAVGKKKQELFSGTVVGFDARAGTYDVAPDPDGSEVQHLPRAELRSLDRGGTLFIDEAYQLDSNGTGRQVLDLLLTEMEERRGELAVVFAGYSKQMDALLEHNEGLKSRFRKRFHFDDFEDDELAHVLRTQLEESGLRCDDDKWVRIAARRLGRLRGTAGFGNAREVRNVVETARERQAARLVTGGGSIENLAFDDVLRRDDVLGPRALTADSTALRDLAGLDGLASVKKSVAQLLATVETNIEREDQEVELQHVSFNRCFVGNPGTGKTTVARIYGQILRDLGLLSKGEVVVKSPSDFIGGALGQSESKTAAILEASVGCVLVIDEAYGLDPSPGGDGGASSRCPYRAAVIDTLVAKVQGVPGEDRCVLLLGYEQQLRGLVSGPGANPGLQRRFQMDHAFRFEDHDDDALFRILGRKAAAAGREIDFDTRRGVVKLLAKQRLKPHFGNAGAVDNALAAAVLASEERMRPLPPAQRAAANDLRLSDFRPERLPPRRARDFRPDAPVDARPLEELATDGLVGLGSFRDVVRGMAATVERAKLDGRDARDDLELTFAFVGAPGTGKTTVARRMGLVLEHLGVLADSNVIETSVTDLVGQYVGQTGPKARAVFEAAKGQVLFIDEAYRLGDASPYAKEAIDEVVTMLTEEAFKGKMVVIFAGYEAEMEAMLEVNSGLKSRVTQKIVFPNLDAQAVSNIARSQLEAKGRVLAFDQAALEAMAEDLVATPDFANARDAETWVKRIIAEGAKAGGKDISEATARNALDSLLQSKAGAAPRGRGAAPGAWTAAGATAQSSHAARPHVTRDAAPHVARDAAPCVEREARDFTGNLKGATSVEAAVAPADDDLSASLQAACVACGYDASPETRAQLAAVLAEFADGGGLADDIMAHVSRGAGETAGLEAALRAQVPAVLESIRKKMQYDKQLQAQLEQMDEAEKQAAIAHELATQTRLMGTGMCPAGFSWFRQGSGWRCGGGSHYVSANDPSLNDPAR